MEFSSVAIIGGGESGIGAALLAKSKGKKVFLSEYGRIKEEYRKELEKYNIPFEEEGHNIERLVEFDIIIKSPGVSDTTEVIIGLNYYHKKIISEIEFGFYFTAVPIIGITGSNGKTTTTGLIYHLLKEAGVLAQVGGNIGKSFARIIFEEEAVEVYVLELSSFQLDGIEKFNPKVAILLNITPDHLDRYDNNFDNYRDAKFRICMNQKSDDLLIYNGMDQAIGDKIAEKIGSQEHIKIRESQYKSSLLSTESGSTFETKNTRLKGIHNRFNAVCAIEAVKHFGLRDDHIQAGLKSFVNAPHRLEHVAMINDVEYINDSKATNVDAVYYALEAMEDKIVWIVGGKDKGNEYESILPLVKDKVSHIICLGKDNEKLKDFFGPYFETIDDTHSTYDAVQRAFEVASPGEVVLLSPACASFDLFRNYEHRGEEFKEEVLRLKL